MCRPLGHIGFFSGLYVTAAFVSLAQLSGIAIAPPPLILLSLTLLATAAYALDRVKLRDSWIDPSDLQSQPERYTFLRPRARAVRLGAFMMLATGGAIGWRITHWAPLAAVMIPIGVAVYAARPRGARARPKDILAIKNAYVAVGIVGFSLLSAIALAAPADTLTSWWKTSNVYAVPLLMSAAVLALRVFLDAALCDIDDEAADKQFGTATLATTFGPRRAWSYTGWMRLALILAIPLAAPCPWRPRVVWTCTSILGMLVLRFVHPERIRDWVDVRLPLEAIVATTTLWMWSTLT